MLVNTRLALTACCAALVAALAGCSSEAPTGQGRVVLGGNDVGAVTGVQCAVDGARATITLDGEKKTTVVVDGGVVESVNIGEVGSGGAALAYLQGVAATPAEVTRDDARYTVTGTGMGTDPANPDVPVDMPFEVEATCP
ncbi:lipoprotein LpqH [Mycobacterium manitobense]|uniref:Lipoprotein LpqH n=1 Tax=[Mycobacterium] manitobense TaxID=190147 RepID=A0A9X2YK38_9MYCO|nr:lipoprotein LpqH [[Mycobacterium] manitobense]